MKMRLINNGKQIRKKTQVNIIKTTKLTGSINKTPNKAKFQSKTGNIPIDVLSTEEILTKHDEEGKTKI